jgi:3-hydroxybenzoate/4-hydroxybenzoate---CoA ligase
VAAQLNAADVILAKAREAPFRDRPAIIHAGGAVAYGALDAEVSRAAHALGALGLARGERVGFLMNDSPRFCAAFLGALRAGDVALALNPRLAAADLAFVVADSEARLIVADPEFIEVARAACAGTAARLVPARGAGDTLETAVARSSPEFPTAATRADEPAFWMYSSGTTGKPKGILHSHANAAHAGKLYREVLKPDDPMVVLATSKLFFAFALDHAFLGALACGATTILNEGWPEPEAILAQARQHRPTIFLTVPTFFRRLLALPKDALAPLATVRVNLTGGERFPDAVAAQWREAVGTELLVVYGMSETFTPAMANIPGRCRADTCGVPLGGVGVKLVGSDGRPVARGEPGVLWVRHPSLALRYRNPEATARAFRDGWFCTGDVFTHDADGTWTHQGRADDLLKVAGQWVNPREIEEAVLADQRIREAACVVVADRDGFDRLAMFVVGADATHVAATRLDGLPRHSQPKWVREVAELPRTATGKVQRFKLREQLEAELRGGER